MFGEAGGNVGLWTRPDSPRIVDAKNIFDYMDGAGELYLGYCFDHLEVYEYQAKSQKNILVELYFMKTSNDAFGLLSLDWGGEPMDLGQGLSRNSGIKAGSAGPRLLHRQRAQESSQSRTFRKPSGFFPAELDTSPG